MEKSTGLESAYSCTDVKRDISEDIKREICEMYYQSINNIDNQEFDSLVNTSMNLKDSKNSGKIIRAAILKAKIERAEK